MLDRYGTPQGFRDYHEARNTDLPPAAADDDDVNAALLVASEYIDLKLRGSVNGRKVGQRAQVRELPRTGMTDADGYVVRSDVIPVEAENATYEAALLELAQPGSLTVNYTPGKYRQVSVEGAVSVTFNMFNSLSEVQTQYQAIARTLAPLFPSCGGVGFSALSGSVSRV